MPSAKPLKKEIIISKKVMSPVGAYAHAVKCGNMIFISGVGPFDEKGRIPFSSRYANKNEIKTQTRLTLENIRRILEDAGASLDNLVQLTAYLTFFERDWEGYNEVMGEYFKDKPPARMTLSVSPPLYGLLIAMTGTAMLSD
ncbi:MAG: RidA family protein [Thaumarchaeota archaeon]|nr:RidA family protein [Nitrososphaerota archaeon]